MGGRLTDFESGSDEVCSTVAFNAGGDSVVLGGTNRLILFNFDQHSNTWIQTISLSVNLYSIPDNCHDNRCS